MWEPPKEVIRLASTGRAKVLNHISTTFVFGWSTRETLFESDNNEGMELLDFGYSQSKWVSEQIVYGAMQRGLSARVFRPALIVPSERGGGYNFDIAIRLLAFMLDHGISTTSRNQVSFTPADVVANNIVAISNLPDTVGETFHVTRDTYSTLLDITVILGSGYPFRSPDPKIWWCQRNRITRSGARIIRGHSWNLTSGSSRRLIVRTSSVAFGGLKGSTVPGAVLPEDGRRAGGCFDARVVPGRPPSRRGLSLRAPASRYGFGSKRCGTSPTRSTG